MAHALLAPLDRIHSVACAQYKRVSNPEQVWGDSIIHTCMWGDSASQRNVPRRPAECCASSHLGFWRSSGDALWRPILASCANQRWRCQYEPYG